jgi:hypothetical protein
MHEGSGSFGAIMLPFGGVSILHGRQAREYRGDEVRWETSSAGITVLLLPDGTRILDPFLECAR